jgi:hypothetical protein
MRRGESIGAVIHICMGATHRNSLCSSLYLKLPKRHVSHIILYVSSSTKWEDRRAEQVEGGGDRKGVGE